MNTTVLKTETISQFKDQLLGNISKVANMVDLTSPAKALRKKYHGKKAERYQRQSRQYVVAAFVRHDKKAKERYNELCVKAASHFNRATSGD